MPKAVPSSTRPAPVPQILEHLASHQKSREREMTAPRPVQLNTRITQCVSASPLLHNTCQHPQASSPPHSAFPFADCIRSFLAALRSSLNLSMALSLALFCGVCASTPRGRCARVCVRTRVLRAHSPTMGRMGWVGGWVGGWTRDCT